jgi:hypothetical protein
MTGHGFKNAIPPPPSSVDPFSVLHHIVRMRPNAETPMQIGETPSDPAKLAAATQAIYERHAARFDAERPKKLHERDWLDRFLALVAPDGPRCSNSSAGSRQVAWFTGEKPRPVFLRDRRGWRPCRAGS